MKYFHFQHPFATELGFIFSSLTIAYHTYGRLNEDKSNVVWICHALTANSNAADWWPGVVGPNCAIDPEKHFIVCANILGSCYGSTGPLNIDPSTGEPYYHRFPFITIRDMAKAHDLLREHLQIEHIHLLAGGSMGGYQALEWALMEGPRINRLFLIATSACETAWGIAIHTAQRMAIEADGTWQHSSPQAGARGLQAARAIGMLSYRNYEIFKRTQSNSDPEKLDHFRASSYLMHQGNKLSQRFNAFSYWTLTKAMDSHNVARGRQSTVNLALAGVQPPTLLISISTDILCPAEEGRIMARHIPHNIFHIIDSPYGHDGFLTEHRQITGLLKAWM